MLGNSKTLAACAAFAVLSLGLAAALRAADHKAPAAKPVSAAFEKLKNLNGEWVAAEDGEMMKKGDLVSRYVLTASGSALVETVFPGTPHEMVTVYHADGSDLVLTHFCMEGNQPRMRARNPQGSEFAFVYDGGTNIDPKHDRHMNSATVSLVGKDEIRAVWTEIADGKPVFVAKTHLVRKAR